MTRKLFETWSATKRKKWFSPPSMRHVLFGKLNNFSSFIRADIRRRGWTSKHDSLLFVLELCRTLLILTTHSALLDCKQQRARVSTSGIRQLTPLGLTEEVFTRASRLLFFGCEERQTSVIRWWPSDVSSHWGGNLKRTAHLTTNKTNSISRNCIRNNQKNGTRSIKREISFF